MAGGSLECVTYGERLKEVGLLRLAEGKISEKSSAA